MTTEAAIPALIPPRSPQELREWTVEDYSVMNQAMGLPADREAVERMAVRDLELYDAVMRERTSTAPTPSAEAVAEQRASRQERVDAKAAEKGATIQRRDTTWRVPNKIEHAKAMPGSRWSYAMGRLKRILDGATNHPDPMVATSTCEIPALAREVFRIQAWVFTRRVPPRPQDEQNPFYGLSEADYVRVLQRRIEDVCDLSSGRLGPWWIPR